MKTFHFVEEIVVSGLPEFHQWAKGLLPLMVRPCIFLLSGDLGAGKTELVKTLVKLVGGQIVTSPTFALHQSYGAQTGAIDHWDLYRLEGEDDLESSGFWDQFGSSDYCLFIEWPERLNWSHLPQRAAIYQIQIHKIASTDQRQLRILRSA